MTEREVKELTQRVMAMSEDEIRVALTAIPTHEIYKELIRRDTERENIINGIRGIVNSCLREKE